MLSVWSHVDSDFEVSKKTSTAMKNVQCYLNVDLSERDLKHTSTYSSHTEQGFLYVTRSQTASASELQELPRT